MKLARIFMVLMALAILLVATVADEKEDKPEAKATEDTKEKESKTGSAVNATATVEKSSDGVDDKAAETATVEEPDSTASTEPDATIQVNPDYVSDDEKSDEESDDEYDSEDEEEVDSKSVLDMALAQSRKVPRKAIDFVQKNRVKITVALALIASRREIGVVILNKIAAPTGVDPKTGKVVVGILYNMDTTGGNSGSPVLNARGELIGLNFDRGFTATINDYAWNEDYSRSIGCDIRYVLYVLKYVSNADKIIEEMGLNL